MGLLATDVTRLVPLQTVTKMPSIRGRQSDIFASALIAAAEAGQLQELQQLLTEGSPDSQTVVGTLDSDSSIICSSCSMTYRSSGSAEWQYCSQGRNSFGGR